MEIETRLAKEKSILLCKIATAAQDGDTPNVMAFTMKLQRVEQLIRQCDEIRKEVETLDNLPDQTYNSDAGVSDVSSQLRTDASLRSTSFKIETGPAPEPFREGAGLRSNGREHGMRCRLEFVKTLPSAARPLEPVTKAVLYAPVLNRRIGVAFARETKKDRWFLGLDEGKFDHAVLLCESTSGKVTHFSLPPDFMEKHRASLSRRDNQLKFNVLRRSGKFFLVVRPGRHISLEPYQDNYYGLS